MSKQFSTYIVANERPTLYTGITNNLIKRVYQHRNGLAEGCTKKYHIHKLVYFESFGTAMEAIIREKQIKDMNRVDKILLIKTKNPSFEDLYNGIL